MGNYNSEYESYYNSMINKKKGRNFSNSPKSSNSRNANGLVSIGNLFSKKRIFHRVLQELIGGLLLFVFLIFCRSNILAQSKTIYTYSKQVVHQDLNFKELYSELAQVKSLRFKDITTTANDFIESFKVGLVGGQGVKDKIRDNYSMPISGKITTTFSSGSTNKNGIDIDAKENSDVACSFQGKVKEIGENATIGKYIEIDHGEGIITKYSNLSTQLVKKDEMVKKGQVIGKSGKAGKSTSPHLHYEILYMGTELDPQEYMKISI